MGDRSVFNGNRNPEGVAAFAIPSVDEYLVGDTEARFKTDPKLADGAHARKRQIEMAKEITEPDEVQWCDLPPVVRHE